MHNRRHPLYEPGVPVYFQIENILRGRIWTDGKPGAALPSEAELAAEFRVTRATIRRALGNLEADRMIVRRKGSGSFVSDESMGVRVKKLTGVIDDFIVHGVKARAKVLECRTAVATPAIVERLGVRLGDPVLYVSRIRVVDDRPLAVIHGYLPWDIGQRVMTEDLSTIPITHLITKKYRIAIPEAENTVEAILADPETAGHLEVPVGSPLLDVEGVYYDRRRKPRYYTRSIFRADRYKFTVSLRQRRET
jgi:GntR family transcriptional regulator